jgi:hypothetical protein
MPSEPGDVLSLQGKRTIRSVLFPKRILEEVFETRLEPAGILKIESQAGYRRKKLKVQQ